MNSLMRILELLGFALLVCVFAVVMGALFTLAEAIGASNASEPYGMMNDSQE